MITFIILTVIAAALTAILSVIGLPGWLKFFIWLRDGDTWATRTLGVRGFARSYVIYNFAIAVTLESCYVYGGKGLKPLGFIGTALIAVVLILAIHVATRARDKARFAEVNGASAESNSRRVYDWLMPVYYSLLATFVVPQFAFTPFFDSHDAWAITMGVYKILLVLACARQLLRARPWRPKEQRPQLVLLFPSEETSRIRNRQRRDYSSIRAWYLRHFAQAGM